VDISLTADVLVWAQRKQTPGLEDGSSSRVRATWIGLDLRYPLSVGLDVMAAYRFSWIKTRFKGDAYRAPDAMGGVRVDTGQVLQLGVGYSL
jgi:hypothetical protein